MAEKGRNRRVKGEGSFRTLPSGLIFYRKTVGRLDDGSRKVLTATAESKAACMRLMKEKECEWARIRDGTVLEQAKTTIRELCEAHLQSQVDNKELKPKSVDRRETTIGHIAMGKLGDMRAASVKGADVEDHISYLQKETSLSESSIVKVVDVLNAAFSWAVRRGDLKSNPVLSVREPLKRRLSNMKLKQAEDADVVVLSEEEQERFISEAGRSFRNGKPVYPVGIYVRLLLATGMRCGELLALRWKDVNLESAYLTIDKCRVTAKNRDGMGVRNYVQVTGTTKNQKARSIRLTEDALIILKEIKGRGHHTAAEDLIALTKRQTPYITTTMEHGVAAIFRNAGMGEYKSSLHIFRRTFATNMYLSGAGVKEVAAYIGDLESTTEKYYISVRRKVREGGKEIHIVEVPKKR